MGLEELYFYPRRLSVEEFYKQASELPSEISLALDNQLESAEYDLRSYGWPSPPYHQR